MQSCMFLSSAENHKTHPIDEQDFPALVKTSCKPINQRDVSLPAFRLQKATEVIEIPFDQRRFQLEDSRSVGKRNDAQSRICMDVVKETGVEVRLTNSKSNSLSISLSGHPDKVAQAKRLIISELQQPETIKVNIPQEFHKHLIGRRGERLRDIQAETMSRVYVPSPNAAEPNIITIVGPKQGALSAKSKILETFEKQAQQGFERLDIPKNFYPFIFGPDNNQLEGLQQRTGTKINVPPPGAQGNIITISGKREDVAAALKIIEHSYAEAKTYKVIPVHVKKSQHQLVYGPRGSGIAEIFTATGVSVERPSDANSEEILLRGKPENLGRALSLVYERAESSITEELIVPLRYHKHMIGRRGVGIKELCDGYDKVRASFDDKQDKVYISGPPEQVSVIVNRLKQRLAELEKTVAVETVRVDPKYFGHIIGRQGATISRYRELNVEIGLPASNSGSPDEIIIEGDIPGVAKAKAEILQLVERLKSEKCKDVIIEPRIQKLLLSTYNGTQPVRAIYDAFPKVSINWPYFGPSEDVSSLDNPTKSVVQLRGDRQQVDAAAERLQKLIKQVIEDNYKQEIRIFKEFRPQIFGRGTSKLQKLLGDTKTRIQYPTDQSDTYTIIGRKENVQQAIQQLEEMQKMQANVKEVVVSIPSALTQAFVGDQAPSLRSIREQCDGVNIRFVNSQKASRKTNQTEVVILGPSEAIEKAQKLIAEMNAKAAQLCAEEFVTADPKFHGYLIGRQGVNIIKFRENHNVELIFPDRTETDQKLASVIRIVGPKEAVTKAKTDLESQIKSIEDEIEVTVPVKRSCLADLVQYRRSFPNPELESVRVIMPRTMGPRPVVDLEDSAAGDGAGADAASVEDTVGVKLIGQKVCVEAASEAIRCMVKDIEEQVTREFPLVDQGQLVALDRARSHFPELERSHRVFLRLIRPAPPNSSSARGAPSTSEGGAGTLVITGRPDRVLMVFEQEITPLLPVEEEMPLAQEFHRALIIVPNGGGGAGAGNNADRGRPKRGQRGGGAATPAPESLSTEPAANHLSKANEFKQKYGVFIRLPPVNTVDGNSVHLHGTPSQIAAAKAELVEWIKEMEALKADRLARSFESSIQVPHRFIQALTAIRPKLTAKYEVGMRFGADHPAVLPTSTAPASGLSPSDGVKDEATTVGEGDTDDHETKKKDVEVEEEEEREPDVEQQQKESEEEEVVVVEDGATVPPVAPATSPAVSSERTVCVILRGYKEKVALAQQELEAEVARLSAQVTESLCIPAKVHSYLIGSRGYAIHKVMQDYKVRIEFPSRQSRETGDADTVLVTGSEKDVDEACDYLISKANDLLDRFSVETRNSRTMQYQEELLPDPQQTSNHQPSA